MKTFKVTYTDKIKDADGNETRKTELIKALKLSHGYGNYIFKAGIISTLTGDPTENVAIIPIDNIYSIVEEQEAC